jgi:hypothetical protein
MIRSGHGPLMTLAFIVCIVGFVVTLTSPVYADGGFGCLPETQGCNQEEYGFCISQTGPDRCSCMGALSGHTTDTCYCSTREYPPCN